MAAVAMVFAGCQKENKGIRLFAEGFNGDSKLSVAGLTSSWLPDDQVNINGTVYDITLDGNSAYVEGVPTDANGYVAFYPTRLNDNGDATNLTFPSVFYYRTVSSGLQNIDAPMYAEASGENVSSLYFKHLGAVLNLHINVTNSDNSIYTDAANISKIEICSNSYRLNGPINFDYTGGVLTVIPAEYEEENDEEYDEKYDDPVPAGRKVTIRPPDNGTTCFTISGTADIQIPVLPVGVDNKFTIMVYEYVSEAYGGPTEKVIFNETQVAGGSLARGQMAYVNVQLKAKDLCGYEHGSDEEDL